MDRYCGPCRNGAACEEHPDRLEDKREADSTHRAAGLIAGVLFLVLAIVVGVLVWEYVQLVRTEP